MPHSGTCQEGFMNSPLEGPDLRKITTMRLGTHLNQMAAHTKLRILLNLSFLHLPLFFEEGMLI